MSRTPSRLIPFQGVPLPRGNLAGIENNTQAILDAIGSLVGATTAGVTFAARGETRALRVQESEFDIERAEALFERAVARDEADELEFKNYIASLANKDAAENLSRVAELERGKLPAMLASMTKDQRIDTLSRYPAMAPENAERLGAAIGEDLADTALAELLSTKGQQIRKSIRDIRDVAGQADVPDVMESLQKWIRGFNTQIETLPDNVRNPAMTHFSGRLRSMAEDELLRGAAQDQDEAELFAENNLKLQVQRLIAGDGVDPSNPEDLRAGIDRMAGLTGESPEAIDVQTGKLLRRGVLMRIDAGESASAIKARLSGIDRRSRIWQSADVGDQGELDPIIEGAIVRQQVSADNGMRQHLQALAIDLERQHDIDGLDDLLTEGVPQIQTPGIQTRARLDIETRIKVVREQQSERIEADAVMAGTRDGRDRGWTRETLEWMYQREIAKGQQKWEVAGRMTEQLGQVGVRVTQDIADSFTDGIANADEGLRMIHAIWEKDAGLAENVLHGLSLWGRAGTKQNQGLRARTLFNLAKEHEPGSPEWNRLAELGQRPGFLRGLIEAENSLGSSDSVVGFPEGSGPDVGEDFETTRSLLQAEVGAILSGSPDLVTPEIISLYRAHYSIAYAREYSDTQAATQFGTPERVARIEVARASARDAITGRWVGVDGVMLTSQQLALTPEMARNEAIVEFIEDSVARFSNELIMMSIPLLPSERSDEGIAGFLDPSGQGRALIQSERALVSDVASLLGARRETVLRIAGFDRAPQPMTHRFFSPDNIWAYVPAGVADSEESQIVAFLGIEPFRRERRMILQGQPAFRSLLRASGINITAETVGPSGRFLWHPQYEVRTVEEFAAKWHGDEFVGQFYGAASEAWVDEGDGPPDLDNPAFVDFLDTYARRHKWRGWLSGPTRRGESFNAFETPIDRELNP